MTSGQTFTGDSITSKLVARLTVTLCPRTCQGTVKTAAAILTATGIFKISYSKNIS